MSRIPQDEMVVLAGDMNGNVGTSNVGYDGCMGVLGMELGMQMAPGSWGQINRDCLKIYLKT